MNEAVITVNNSNNPKNMRLKITYSAGIGSLSITKIESCRTDGYDTTWYDHTTYPTPAHCYIRIKDEQNAFADIQKYDIYFYKNSNYTTLYQGNNINIDRNGSRTVEIYFSGANTNINNSYFAFDVNFGYKTPAMSIDSSEQYLEGIKLTCSYSNAEPEKIQIYNETTEQTVYEGTSLTPTISNLVPNTTYSFKARGYANNLWGDYSTSVTVATLRQAYVTQITPLTNESTELKFTAYNPSGLPTKVTIKGVNPDTSAEHTIYTNVSINIPAGGQEFTFEITSGHKNGLNQISPNNKQINLLVILTTEGNQDNYTFIGNSTYTIVSSDPTLGTITYADTNPTTTAITNNNQNIIENYSIVTITIPKMTPLNYATAGYYNIIKDNNLIASFDDDGSNTYTVECGTVGFNSTLQVEAVDSRNNSTIVNVGYTFTTFAEPYVSSVSYARQNDVGERVTVKAEGRYSRLAGTENKNSVQRIEYRYREVNNDGSYGSWSQPQNLSSYNDYLDGTWKVQDVAINGDTAQGYNSEKSYQIELTVVDKLSRGSNSNNISTAKPTVWYDKQHKRVGVGKKPEESLDVTGIINASSGFKINGSDLVAYIVDQAVAAAKLADHPVGSYYFSDDPTDPSTLFGGTWTRVKERFVWLLGDTGNAGDTGGEATHTLTIAEMPTHNHNSRIQWGDTSGDHAAPFVEQWNQNGNAGVDRGLNNDGNTGGGQAHNNMPPYIAAYGWKRTQ